MIKLLPLLLFVSSICHAQNWQCLQYGVKHYFINGNGYLRGIRIDSIKTSGSDVIYYPFHTPRGSYGGTSWSYAPLDSNGGSWLGEKVIAQNDGTFLFDNIWNDTIIIKTKAQPGETWTFYNDTTDLYYKATVFSNDTMTVLGAVDSIKKIMITAYNTSGIVPTDPLDSFQIFLSKNNGFALTFDLYTFPYHNPDTIYDLGVDYFLDKAANTDPAMFSQFTLPYSGINQNTQIFKLISLFNPTNEQLYDWSIGDVYQYSSCNGLCQWPSSICAPASTYILDTILTKSITSSNTQYDYTGLTSNLLLSSPYIWMISDSFIYSTSPSSGTHEYTKSTVLDTILMPEEYKQQYLLYYFPNDTSYCMTSPLYISNLSYIHGAEYWRPFEGLWVTTINKHKLGLVHHYSLGMDWAFLVRDKTLLYYNRGGITCGSIVTPPTSINEITLSKNNPEIYPNPATNTLTITSNNQITQLTITNLIGQTINSNTPNTEKAELNISNLPPGIYLIKINDTIVKKFIKEN